MVVDGLRVGITNPNAAVLGKPYVLVLKEKTSERYLPIHIDPAHADAIRCKLLNRSSDIVATYELVG